VPQPGAGLEHDEAQALPGEVPGHGQAGLAAADHDHIQQFLTRWIPIPRFLHGACRSCCWSSSGGGPSAGDGEAHG
jgi:hypothetical protein